MYLTRIRDLEDDRYRVHQQIMDLYEGTSPRYQLNSGTALIISDIPPKSDSHIVSNNIDTFINGINNGFETMFTVLMDGMKRGRKSRKMEPIPQDRLKDALDLKFSRAGFQALFSFDVLGSIRIEKPGCEHSVIPVFCSGGLTVTDSVLFKQALLHGISSTHKTFGFGMLNIYHTMPVVVMPLFTTMGVIRA